MGEKSLAAAPGNRTRVQTLQTVFEQPLCAIACINICGHVEGPLVRVRVRWLMETLEQPACTVGCVARLCRSWFSPGKVTRISLERNPIGTIRLLKNIYNKNKNVKEEK